MLRGVVVVTDDLCPALLAGLSRELRHASFEVPPPPAEPADLVATLRRADFLILAEVVFGSDTEQVCAWMRIAQPRLCTIVVTEQAPRVRQWLDAGADDAVARECDVADIAARVRAVARLKRLDADWIDALSRGAALTPAETQIVRVLALSRGQPVHRRDLAVVALGRATAWTVVYMHVARLRKKLPAGVRVRAVYGHGYQLERDTART